MDIGQGITIGSGINISQRIVLTGGVLTLTAGTLAPRYGAGAFTRNPTLDGWTQQITANADDANFLIPGGFKFYIYGTEYTGVYPGSNAYITFGAGSNFYSNINLLSTPALPGVHIASADNSWQRVWYLTDNLTYAKIRFEGTNNTSGSVGSPNMVYECSFYKGDANYQYIEILCGTYVTQLPANFGITKGNGTNFLSGGTISQNQSYVIRTDLLGNNPQFFTGYYMSV